jgi:5'-nucleotidase
MRILISNDDGILAPGLQALEKIARELTDDVWIVAPETDQSGFAHSLTLHDPLRARKVGDKKFAVHGTPTDCVIMGVRQILPEQPDLVLSGVNAGTNIADDVTYSGTVACAIESTLIGIPALALSQAYEDNQPAIPFETAVAHGPGIIDKLMRQGIPHGTYININFPSCAPGDVVGIEATRQGTSEHTLGIEKRIDCRKRPYYWLTYSRGELATVPGTDAHAIAENRISVTPLGLDLTHHAGIARLKDLF